MNYDENYFDKLTNKIEFVIGDHIDNKFLHATIVGTKKDKHGIIYNCKCDKCSYIYERFRHQIYNGIGCGACAGKIVVKGINDIPTTAPWMVKYFQGGDKEASNYTQNSGKPFRPRCPFCGRISDKDTTPNRLNHIHGINCVCKDGVTIPNKIIRGLMEQALSFNMILSYQKEFVEYDENGVLRKFDMKFYDINGNPYFIEMDGGLHGYIKKKHSKKKFVALPAKSLLSDLMKDNIAEKLKIPLIRIDCYKSSVDYIKTNIYNSELSNILDLDKIDWLELENICFRNIMADVCEFKKKNPNVFSSEAAMVFNLSTSSVIDYWKRGNKLGLCEYNALLEKHRKNIMNKDWYKTVGVYVENLDTNESWEFNTKTEFSKESSKILDGDVLTKSKIEKMFKKTNNDYLFYDTGEHEFLIWLSRRK